jgi:predicted metalloendopeptidase
MAIPEVRGLLWLVLAMAHVGCAAQRPPAPRIEPGGDLTPVDENEDPCVDFVDYACGGRGIALGRLQREAGANNTWFARKVEYLTADAPAQREGSSPQERVVRSFFARCQDSDARRRGLVELRRDLDRLGEIDTLPELARALGVLHAQGRRLLVDLVPIRGMDPDAPMRAAFDMADSDLSPRDFEKETPALKELRTHFKRIASLTGVFAPQEVDAALRVQSWFARQAETWPDDVDATSTAVSDAELNAARFPWRAYFEGLGRPNFGPLVSHAPDVLARIDEFASLPLPDLKSYTRVWVADLAAPFLTETFLQEELRSHKEVFADIDIRREGLTEPCVQVVEYILGDSLDQLVALARAAPADETRAFDHFAILRAHLVDRIRHATWMDLRSRKAAADKIAGIELAFGKDLRGPDFSGFEPGDGSLLAEGNRIVTHRFSEALDQVGNEVTPFVMDPSKLVAAYSHETNAVWISPWGISLPGRHGLEDPVTYGSLGATLGHELGHALSPEGSRFDSEGYRRETWSKPSVDAYARRVSCFEAQLDELSREPRSTVKPKQHLNEHVADAVGLRLAIETMDARARLSGERRTRLERHREFFLAYAQVSCGQDPGYFADDPHAMAAVRVNATVANLPEFATAFGCKAGAFLAPARRCSLW